jgi:hypothetical protein
MITTTIDARFSLDRQLLARQAAGLSATLEQIDCVLCDDGATIMVYAYLAGCGDVITTVFDKPARFDRHAYAERLLGHDRETVHLSGVAMPSTLGISTWCDFGGVPRSSTPPYILVHLARAGDGVVVDEDSGARYILGPPDGLDRASIHATGAMSDDNGETGPAAWIRGGMKGFKVARVPVDVHAGEARLRLEIEGRDPIRLTSKWTPPKRPEAKAAAPPKRARRARTARS